MTSYHFCHILFLRRRLLGLAFTQGEGIIQGHENQKTRTTESHVRSYLSQQATNDLCHNPNLPLKVDAFTGPPSVYGDNFSLA